MAEQEGARNNGAGSALRNKEAVPYERFAEVNTELKAAKARLAELEPKVTDLDKITKKAESYKAAHEADKAAWADERGLFSAGITDTQGHVVAKALWSTLPEADRPALGEWVASLKEDPTKAPPGLAPYLPGKQPASAAPPAATPSAAQTNGGAPKPTGTGAAPGSPGGVSAEALAAARQSGDLAKIRELLKAAGYNPPT
jgi:hypothetical protein